MSDDSFASVMIDVVRKDQSYMEIVFRLAELFPQLKETIASSFMQKLRDELVRLNPNWLVENEFKLFNKNYETLSLRRAIVAGRMGYTIGDGSEKFQRFLHWILPGRKRYVFSCGANKNQIKGALEEPLKPSVIGFRPVETGSYGVAPTPFKDWTIETFLLLAELKKVPDERTALTTFVDWFQLLVNALGNKIDTIQAELNQGASR